MKRRHLLVALGTLLAALAVVAAVAIIRVRANQGFEIYLNGRLLSAYGWWNSTPEYSKVMQGDRSWLKKGTNHLAVRAGSDYHNGVHVGQIDVYLESLRKEDLLDRGKR